MPVSVMTMGIIILAVALLLAGADQLIKIAAVNNLQGMGKVTVIDNLLYLTYTENRGAAFSMLSNHRWIFIAFTVAALAVLIFIIFKFKIKDKLFVISSMLIIGGGIGNLIDRIRFGYVVDYIYWSFFTPVCNFADYCITCGTVILMIYIIFFTDILKDDKKIPSDAAKNTVSDSTEHDEKNN